MMLGNKGEILLFIARTRLHSRCIRGERPDKTHCPPVEAYRRQCCCKRLRATRRKRWCWYAQRHEISIVAAWCLEHKVEAWCGPPFPASVSRTVVDSLLPRHWATRPRCLSKKLRNSNHTAQGQYGWTWLEPVALSWAPTNKTPLLRPSNKAQWCKLVVSINQARVASDQQATDSRPQLEGFDYRQPSALPSFPPLPHLSPLALTLVPAWRLQRAADAAAPTHATWASSWNSISPARIYPQLLQT